MASIQKIGKTYQYSVSRMIDGKYRPIRKGSFRTKKEAQIAAAEVETQLAKGLIPVLKKVPLDEYFENWIKLYKEPKVTPVTLDHYKSSLKAIKKYFYEWKL